MVIGLPAGILATPAVIRSTSPKDLPLGHVPGTLNRTEKQAYAVEMGAATSPFYFSPPARGWQPRATPSSSSFTAYALKTWFPIRYVSGNPWRGSVMAVCYRFPANRQHEQQDHGGSLPKGEKGQTGNNNIIK